jgi:hypothetical protein
LQPNSQFPNDLPPEEPTPPQELSPRRKQQFRPTWFSFLQQQRWLQLRSWQVLPIAILLPVGVGIVALSMLTTLPEFSECEPTKIRESGSLRLFCAQKLANDKTEDSYLRAMQMLNGLPEGDPFEEERDRLMKQWATDLLALAEEKFQNGKLDDAIALANKIPARSTLSQNVQERIDRWQEIWSDAEEMYGETELAIAESRWESALEIARRLAVIGNRYWETTQYQELARKIQVAKEDSEKQAKAKKKTDKPKQSDDLMTQWEKDQEAEDIAHLKQAQGLAAAGDVESLRKAIDEADRVLYGTPRYQQAQQLVVGWKRQIETLEDRPYLDRANELAKKGTVESLRAAIDEANQIFFDRSLYSEAQRKVNQWTSEIQRLQTETDLRPQLAPASSTTLSNPASAAPSGQGNSPTPTVNTTP